MKEVTNDSEQFNLNCRFTTEWSLKQCCLANDVMKDSLLLFKKTRKSHLRKRKNKLALNLRILQSYQHHLGSVQSRWIAREIKISFWLRNRWLGDASLVVGFQLKIFPPIEPFDGIGETRTSQSSCCHLNFNQLCVLFLTKSVPIKELKLICSRWGFDNWSCNVF